MAVAETGGKQRRAGRLGRGEWLAGASGLALLAITFIPWFAWKAQITITTSSDGSYRGGGLFTAWQASPLISIAIVVAAIAALAVALCRGLRLATLPLVADQAVAALGAVALILIMVSMIAPPNLRAILGSGITLENPIIIRAAGVYLAAVAAAGVTEGGLISLRSRKRAAAGR